MAVAAPILVTTMSEDTPAVAVGAPALGAPESAPSAPPTPAEPATPPAPKLPPTRENKEKLQAKANMLRRERDRLNDEARRHAEERDGFNGQVRALVNEANEHKKRRDEMNDGVKRAKEARDEANRSADEAQKVAETLRRQRMPEGAMGDSVAKLKKEARQLEFQQMTTVLTPTKERALVERLQEIGKLIRAKEKALRADPELAASLSKADELKEKAEKAHAKVGEMAEKAQAEHDAMIKLYKQSDKLRKQADKLQEKFVVAKMEGDKIHKAYIEVVNQIHEIEDALAGQAPGTSGQQGGGGGAAAQARSEAAAELVYQKFKAGEKLSTEDLLTLQKAGLL